MKNSIKTTINHKSIIVTSLYTLCCTMLVGTLVAHADVVVDNQKTEEKLNITNENNLEHGRLTAGIISYMYDSINLEYDINYENNNAKVVEEAAPADIVNTEESLTNDTVENTTDEVEITTMSAEDDTAKEETAVYNLDSRIVNPYSFIRLGTVQFEGHRWTYYSEKVLPGGGLNIPGRHADEYGFICDEDGYIVLAADLNDVARGSVVNTPFGKQGKIYDTGCDYGTIDCYCNW